MMMNKIEELDSYVEKGLLRKAVSEDGKLAQYNYTDACVFEKHWDDITLNNRGNVYELATGKLVAKVFGKFFNWEELNEIKQQQFLNHDKFYVFEKVDGCLSCLYNYEGNWRLNSRGSFDSFASRAGNRILQKYDLKGLNPEVTYIFEVISPETKIIIDYHGEERLVLLGAYYTQSGQELNYATIQVIARSHGFSLPKVYFYTFEELFNIRKTLTHNEEGFVVKLLNGCRFKLKSLEYLKVAKLLQNCTKRELWKQMVDGRIDIKNIAALLDEHQNEALKYRFELEEEYFNTLMDINEDFENVCQILFDKTSEEVKANPNVYAKEMAGTLEDCQIKIRYDGAMFSCLRNKSLDKYIMKIIEPQSL
jgi:RNA ligase